MRFSSVLLALILLDICYGRSMQRATLKKRFQEAKYVFKFRVISEPISKCITTIATTQESTTTASTTQQPITDDTTLATSSSPTSRRRTTSFSTKTTTTTTAMPSTHSTTHTMQTSTRAEASLGKTDLPTSKSMISLVKTDLSTSKPMTSLGKTDLPTSKPMISLGKTDLPTSKPMISLVKTDLPTSMVTSAPSKNPERSTDNPKPTSQKLDATSTVQTSSTTLQNKLASEASPSTNATDGAGAGRKKRSCEMVVYSQFIRFREKKIYKGCEGIGWMRWIAGMNDIYEGNIRLQMDFPPLKKNRNYLFMGREVPGQDVRDYVFMADENTVVNWKPDAIKLKKLFKASKERC